MIVSLAHLDWPYRKRLQKVVQSAKKTISDAEVVQSLAGITGLPTNLHITETYSLYTVANDLVKVTHVLSNTADTLKETVENFVIGYLTSLGGKKIVGTTREFDIEKMLSHFDKHIRSIIRDFLRKPTGLDLWKIVEECYNQATSYPGTLRSEDFFDAREEACSESPYDPDYEAEEYYEHENRLDVDEDYAKGFQDEQSRRSERHAQQRDARQQNWINFWGVVLNNCPGGPTLFYPPATYEPELLKFAFEDTPRYLFRTFDQKGSGTNNAEVISSIASASESSKNLLSLSNDKATEMLYAHLNKSCLTGESSDNLMSWTSSLLFAIQYAIWRRCKFGNDSTDIKICVVDTTKFPRGQFAQDAWLLQAYQETAIEIGGDTQDFFRFRLEDERYHNGEYLSQGILNHAGRSSMCSLQSLEDAGLYELYPEFANPQGTSKWTKRVLELRQTWRVKTKTNAGDIQLAFKVARNCFTDTKALHMALILLTFRNRKLIDNLKVIEKRYKKISSDPFEVQRFVTAVKWTELWNRVVEGLGHGSRIFDDSLDIQTVQKMFECI